MMHKSSSLPPHMMALLESGRRDTVVRYPRANMPLLDTDEAISEMVCVV
jgi:hypothetical protein